MSGAKNACRVEMAARRRSRNPGVFDANNLCESRDDTDKKGGFAIKEPRRVGNDSDGGEKQRKKLEFLAYNNWETWWHKRDGQKAKMWVGVKCDSRVVTVMG